jgi:type IV pilus biogenesis protein PilP
VPARNRLDRNTVVGVFLLLLAIPIPVYIAWGELSPLFFAEEDATPLVSLVPPAKAPAEEPLTVPAPSRPEKAEGLAPAALAKEPARPFLPAPVQEAARKSPSAPAVSPAPSGSQTASRETVGLLSVLLGELEVRRAELALMEVSKKIEELSAPSPVVIAAPVAKPAPPPAVPLVVAIEGMGGRLRALMRTERGLRTVTAGEALDSGRVIGITLDSVQYEDRDGKRTTLPVEE